MGVAETSRQMASEMRFVASSARTRSCCPSLGRQPSAAEEGQWWELWERQSDRIGTIPNVVSDTHFIRSATSHHRVSLTTDHQSKLKTQKYHTHVITIIIICWPFEVDKGNFLGANAIVAAPQRR